MILDAGDAGQAASERFATSCPLAFAGPAHHSLAIDPGSGLGILPIAQQSGGSLPGPGEGGGVPCALLLCGALP